MADNETKLSSQIYIKVNGARVSDDVMSNLAEVVVDQHSHLPDMFALRLHDPTLRFVDKGPFDLADAVEIGSYAADGRPTSLIQGEVTALEPNFNASMIAELVVRGYDRSHRLYRDQKSRAFVNVRDSDLAQTIATEAGLQSQVELTPLIYDHVYQHNQSDLGFLLERAWRIGYECFVEEDTLYFRKPAANGATGVTLRWGEDMLSVQPRMTVAEQVEAVMVKGWDYERQRPIVGQADNGSLFPDIEEEKDGADWARQFGRSRLMITDQPVRNQEEANLLAAARMDEISGTFVEVEGSVFRRPDVRAGRVIVLAGLGKRFSGRYLVTSATHSFSAEGGLETDFTVRGLRNGLLAEQMQQQTDRRRWYGVAPAVVTNVDDPRKLGRVRVKFPWLTEESESDWARVVFPQGGPMQLPAVDEEVLVAFEHGEFSRPYVLGGMNNQVQPLPEAVAGAATGEAPLIWHSRSGHTIALYDGVEKRVDVKTAAGHQIRLDDSQDQVEIRSKSGLTIRLDERKRRITVESQGDVAISAQGNMNLDANGNMNLTAKGNVNVKGAVINLN